MRSLVMASTLTWVAACGDGPTAPSPPGPTLACPAAMDLQSPDDSPVSVAYPTPTPQGGVAPVNVQCTPATGSAFPVGTTTVSCTATDAQSRSSSCTFTVRVRPVPRLAATRFLAFGDSLTWGVVAAGPFMSAPYSAADSYPFKFMGLLGQRYTRQSFSVTNSGLPGECASDCNNLSGRRRLPGELAARQPEVLVLMEGTNDLFVYLERATTIGISALDDMIREGKSRVAHVFIATIPPQRAGGIRARDAVVRLIPSFNNEIRALAGRHAIPVIDVYSPLQEDLSRYVGPDDLHLTADGYTVVAETIFDAIKSTLETTPTALLTHVR